MFALVYEVCLLNNFKNLRTIAFFILCANSSLIFLEGQQGDSALNLPTVDLNTLPSLSPPPSVDEYLHQLRLST